MAISQFVDTTGNILNRYTLTHEDSTTETVRLTFNPSDDYVAGTPFNALHMNPIVNKVNSLDTQVGSYSFWCGTQAEYDAIETKSNTTLYFIKAS